MNVPHMRKEATFTYLTWSHIPAELAAGYRRVSGSGMCKTVQVETESVVERDATATPNLITRGEGARRCFACGNVHCEELSSQISQHCLTKVE